MGDIRYSTYYRQDIYWAREGDVCICLKVGRGKWYGGMEEMCYYYSVHQTFMQTPDKETFALCIMQK